MNEPRTILFVCSGNTCRSPLAAALFARYLTDIPDARFRVESAGVAARNGAPASEGAYLVGLEHGLDLGAHRARLLTPEIAARADLVLTMTQAQAERLPHLGLRNGVVWGLTTYAAGTERAADIQDPFGGPLDGYRATLSDLDRYVGAVYARLTSPSP